MESWFAGDISFPIADLRKLIVMRQQSVVTNWPGQRSRILDLETLYEIVLTDRVSMVSVRFSPRHGSQYVSDVRG